MSFLRVFERQTVALPLIRWTVSLGLVLSMISCGGAEKTEDTQSKLASDVQKKYGVRFDIPLSCGATRADAAVDTVIENARKFGEFCEKQNEMSAARGFMRCPYGLCQTESKPGGVVAPTVKLSINNGTSMGGMFGGFGSYGMGSGSSSKTGSGSGFPGGGSGSGESDSVFGRRLYVSLELTLPLAKSPDQLTCVNPLSPDVMSSTLKEISKAVLDSKDEPCASPAAR
jgi:hypothetical protein